MHLIPLPADIEAGHGHPEGLDVDEPPVLVVVPLCLAGSTSKLNGSLDRR